MKKCPKFFVRSPTGPCNNTLLPGEEKKARGYNREVKKQARSLDVKNSPLVEFFVSILFKNIEKGSRFTSATRPRFLLRGSLI